MDANTFFDKAYVYAIVGASNDPDKYGNRVLRDLMAAGYHVIPINPKEQEIEGEKAYPSVQECPEHIDVAVFIVPPQVTLRVLEQMPKDIGKVWMQPGASDDACVQYCNDHDIDYMHNACVMVQKPR